MNKKLLLLLSTLVWLNLLDLLSTYVILGLGGKETNFVFLHFNHSGIGLLDVLVKFGLTVGMCVLIYLPYRKAVRENSKIPLYMIYGITIGLIFFMSFIVVKNLYMLNAQMTEVMKNLS